MDHPVTVEVVEGGSDHRDGSVIEVALVLQSEAQVLRDRVLRPRGPAALRVSVFGE